MLGGPIIGGETLSRFFSLHVFLIPGGIIALVAMHLRLVLSLGINEYPKAGKPVRKATYRDEYEVLVDREGVAFVPGAISKDLIFSAALILTIFGLAAVTGPPWPDWTARPDPNRHDSRGRTSTSSRSSRRSR
jgi:ubiquinol-cytochrome c reductase cytochrome b subunit